MRPIHAVLVILALLSWSDRLLGQCPAVVAPTGYLDIQVGCNSGSIRWVGRSTTWTGGMAPFKLELFKTAAGAPADLLLQQAGITVRNWSWQLVSMPSQHHIVYAKVTDATGCASTLTLVMDFEAYWFSMEDMIISALPPACATGMGSIRVECPSHLGIFNGAFQYTLTASGRPPLTGSAYLYSSSTTPGNSYFLIPSVPSGTYSLQVRSTSANPAWICPNTTTRSVTVTSECRSWLSMRASLGGAQSSTSTLMGDGLRSHDLIPLIEPYGAAGYGYTGVSAGGGLHADTRAILSSTGTDAIVDWVVVELRDPAVPSQVVSSRPALIQRDGDIVDMDGGTSIGFPIVAGTYHVALRHRNHLGVMTASPVSVTATGGTLVDLRLASTAVYGTDTRRTINGIACLWPGDVNMDGTIRYIGAANDRDPVLGQVGGSVPTATAAGYFGTDVNLDGTVKYIGTGNDRDLILNSVGGSVPTAMRTQQLP